MQIPPSSFITVLLYPVLTKANHIRELISFSYDHIVPGIGCDTFHIFPAHPDVFMYVPPSRRSLLSRSRTQVAGPYQWVCKGHGGSVWPEWEFCVFCSSTCGKYIYKIPPGAALGVRVVVGKDPLLFPWSVFSHPANHQRIGGMHPPLLRPPFLLPQQTCDTPGKGRPAFILGRKSLMAGTANRETGRMAWSARGRRRDTKAAALPRSFTAVNLPLWRQCRDGTGSRRHPGPGAWTTVSSLAGIFAPFTPKEMS